MQDIKLTLSDAQEELLCSIQKIEDNKAAQVDFQIWLQSQIDRCINLYSNKIAVNKIKMAKDIINYDIMGKINTVVEALKEDKDATITIVPSKPK